MAAFGQKIRLLMGLLRGDTAYVGPFYVTVDITRRCNLQCIGCRFHSPISKKSPFKDDPVMDIPFDLFKTLCDGLQKMGTNSILLTGEGEPLLHPRIFDMISVAKEAGLHVILFTNGTLLDETRVQSLLDACPDTLRVSLWASSPEEYEKNCPGSDPATFLKTMEGLKLLTRLKADRKSLLPSVILHHPINRNNFENVNDMVNLAYQAGCNALTFSPLKCWWGSLGSVSLSQTEENQLFHSLIQMEEKLDSFSLKHNIENTVLRYKIGYAVWQKMPCYIAWLHVRIRVNGNVLPCHRYALPMGNLNEERLQEIWNNPAFRAFRTKTMTRLGLTSIAEHCDCNFCGFIHDNMQVHRVFKWFSPFASMNRGKEGTQQRS
jgi:radical SAM protein with 4Fe4S-binding SPASM domain